MTEFCAPNLHVEGLTPCTSECDYLEVESSKRQLRLNGVIVGALIQYD